MIQAPWTKPSHRAVRSTGLVLVHCAHSYLHLIYLADTIIKSDVSEVSGISLQPGGAMGEGL